VKQQSSVLQTVQPGHVTWPTECQCTPQSHSGLMSLLLQYRTLDRWCCVSVTRKLALGEWYPFSNYL